MTLRRLLAGMAAIIATLFAFAGPAQAGAVYPVVRGDATVSATTVTVGGSVTVSGGGFSAADCPVILTVRVGNKVYITQTLTPDSDGNVSATVKLTRTGRNVIELTGCQANGATRVLSARVTVRGAGAGSGLPNTGVDLTSLYAGFGLLAAGALLVMVTRQRRKVLV